MLRNVVFVVLVPGVVGGILPYVITRYSPRDLGRFGALFAVMGWALVVAGAAVLLYGVWRFAAEGRGTPSPSHPTERLVIAGPYRYVRNPMYLAVGAVILGQAILFAGVVIWVYLALFAVAVVIFVKAYEEPTLTRTFGDEYVRYKRRVPGWWPRVTRS